MSNVATFPTTTATSTHATGIAARIFGAVKAAYERRVLRQTYEDLLGAEDQIFRDIGISRGDVRKALDACR